MMLCHKWTSGNWLQCGFVAAMQLAPGAAFACTVAAETVDKNSESVSPPCC